MTRYITFAAALLVAAGCSRPSPDQSPNASVPVTPVSFNASGAPTVEFSVPDMMCPEGCGAKVKEILSQQPGAKDVIVDFPAKKAIVAVDKDKFDAKQAVAALVDHQFKKSTLKDAASNSTASSTVPSASKTVQ
jgi:copper chaperone CopZ